MQEGLNTHLRLPCFFQIQAYGQLQDVSCNVAKCSAPSRRGIFLPAQTRFMMKSCDNGCMLIFDPTIWCAQFFSLLLELKEGDRQEGTL